MSSVNEIEAITILENTLSQLEDPAARDRVLKWAWDKYSTRPSPLTDMATEINKPPRKGKKKAKSPAKTKSGPSIVKDLNLNPEGKKSFRDFVQEKQPSTNQEKCTAAIYYLRHELGIDNISINHVFTCYKNANWRVTDLYNILVLTASRKGWVDTSNTENIAITTHGENLVEFDLPHKTKGK
jgi:hypothetical protein